MRSALEKDRNKIALLFTIILIVAVGAVVFLFFNMMAAKSEMTALVSADYAGSRVEATKRSEAELPGLSLREKQKNSLAVDVYETPLGFDIISYSQKWTGEKLNDVYNELISNEHGDEIRSISKVVIYPKESGLDSGSAVAGTHVTKRQSYSVFFHLPGIVPDSLVYGFNSTMSTIELYDMDKYDNISQIARTIAHEYGHHYTMYYFLQNNEAAKQSEYYKLRGIDNLGREVFYDIESEYYENHMWSLYEIAAEDYVQLMGSPGAKQTREYLDVYDVLEDYEANKNYKAYADASIINVYPQENINIPLADEINGLRDYYYSFIGKQNNTEDLGKASFNLKMTAMEKYGYPYYEITWNKTTQDQDALYTLVCFDKDKNIYLPVRSIRGDERPVARVGTAVQLSGITLTTLTNKVTDEDRYFKLYVIWPDGRMQSSEMFYADF